MMSFFLRNFQIHLSDLRSGEKLTSIYFSPQNYYWTPDWSPEMYVALARAGFIAISKDIGEYEEEVVLIPEIQHSYAVLDWEDLHISKSTRRWMRSSRCLDEGYELNVNYDLRTVARGIDECHTTNWMSPPYVDVLSELHENPRDGLQVMPVGLVNKDGELVAGEIGYRTGNIYTSLTGFMKRSGKKYNHTGKLQLYLLGEYLRDSGCAFWNLGHPHMQYKVDLGAKIVDRIPFLERWYAEL